MTLCHKQGIEGTNHSGKLYQISYIKIKKFY